jgi:hypothetical protein
LKLFLKNKKSWNSKEIDIASKTGDLNIRWHVCKDGKTFYQMDWYFH